MRISTVSLESCSREPETWRRVPIKAENVPVIVTNELNKKKRKQKPNRDELNVFVGHPENMHQYPLPSKHSKADT